MREEKPRADAKSKNTKNKSTPDERLELEKEMIRHEDEWSTGCRAYLSTLRCHDTKIIKVSRASQLCQPGICICSMAILSCSLL